MTLSQGVWKSWHICLALALANAPDIDCLGSKIPSENTGAIDGPIALRQQIRSTQQSCHIRTS